MQGSQAQRKVIITQAQAKRLSQNIKGIVISVVVCVALVIPIYLMAPHPGKTAVVKNVDVMSIAQGAAPALKFTPVVATLPQGWSANFARIASLDGPDVPRWEVGYLADGKDFIQLTQTNQASPTWIMQQTQSAPATGSRTVDGQTWELRGKPGDQTYLVHHDGDSAVVLGGQVPVAELEKLAGTLHPASPAPQPTPGASS